MLPSRFDYVAPTSLDEVLDLLREHGDDAKVLAGGQSLIPMMKLRLARPALLIDLNRVPGLAGFEEGPTHLRIGALTRNSTLVDSELLAERYSLMATTAPLISDPIIRNLGTIGGSLAHADPSGDWGSVILALDGEVVARSTTGERTIPIRDFFDGTFTSTLEPTELLTEVRVPLSPARSGGTYLKLERKVGDFATAAVAVQLELDNGRVGRAGIGLTSVGPENLAARSAEDLLRGAEPSEELFAEAGRLAAGVAQPSDDVRGSAEYKREVVRVFVQRGLSRALEIARGS